MGLRKLAGKPIDVIEVTVGLVSVLFLQLGIVEGFVVKSRELRSGRLRAWRRCVMVGWRSDFGSAVDGNC